MKTSNQYSSNLLRKYIFVLVGWSALVAGSLAWNLHQERCETMSAATAAARTNINKDFSFRKWVASHGGIYVTPSERTPPTPISTYQTATWSPLRARRLP